MAIADIAIRIVTKGAELAKRQVDGLGGSAGKSGKMLQTFAKAGAVAGVAIGTVLAKALTSGTRNFMDFQDAMTQSVAIMKTTEEQNQRMADSARQVAITTRISARDSAEAFFFLASAGLDAEQSISALPQVAKFAQAGMFDMATATDLATDAQSALGLTVSDAEQNLENLTRVTDVLVKANTLANASVQQFSEALTNKAGSALKVANKGIEEGVAVLSAFADRGVKGAEAGEKLNQLLRDIPRATAKNSEEFKKLNLEMFDSQGNLLNVADLIDNLDTVLAPMSDELKATTLDQLGLNRGVADAVKILSGASSEIRTYQKALEDSGGMTEQVADNQMNSLSAEMDILKDKFIDASMAMIEDYEPAMRDAIQITGGFLDLIAGRAVTDMETFAKMFDATAFAVQFLTKTYTPYSSMVEEVEDILVRQKNLDMAGHYRQIGEEQAKGVIHLKDYQRNSERVEQEMYNQRDAVEDLTASLEDNKKEVDALNKAMADEQFDAIMTMINAEEAYNDIFKENEKLLKERNNRLNEKTDAEKALKVAEENLSKATETANQLAKDGTDISNQEALAIARQTQRRDELIAVEDKSEIQKLELAVAEEKLIELEEKATEQSGKYRDAKRDEERALEDVKRAQDDLARAVEDANKAQDDFNEATAKTPQNLAEIASAHKDMMDAIADVKALDTLKNGMEEFVEGTGQSLAGLLLQLEKIMSFSSSSFSPPSTSIGGGNPPPINPPITTDTSGQQNNDSALSDIVAGQGGAPPFFAGMTPNVISVINNYNIEQASADQQAQRVAELTQRATRNGIRFA